MNTSSPPALVARLAFATGESSTMGDSVPPSFASVCPPSSSPAPGTQIIPGMRITSGGHGLVPVVRLPYAAPGGDYRRRIQHVLGCRNDGSDFDNEVRLLISTPSPLRPPG